MTTPTLSSTMEDYLEAIHTLQQSSPVTRVRDIARALHVKMPSVTSAVRALGEQGLVRHERYGYVDLTPEGREVAEQVHRRHIALVGFLTDILQLEPEQAEREACELEHGLTPETLRRLLGLLEFVRGCPRSGDDWLTHMRERWEDRECNHDCAPCIEHIVVPERGPFRHGPSRHGAPHGAAATLDRQQPGFKGKVVRVTGRGPVRRRLMEMGVTVGTEVELERLAPLGDPLELKLRGYHLSLRKDEAARVCVEPV